MRPCQLIVSGILTFSSLMMLGLEEAKFILLQYFCHIDFTGNGLERDCIFTTGL